jgi:hypothetical protein
MSFKERIPVININGNDNHQQSMKKYSKMIENKQELDGFGLHWLCNLIDR